MPGEISFGDHVRVIEGDETRRGGWAGLLGQCYGVTTPSVTGVEVIGGSKGDIAFNVHFDDDSIADAWFHPVHIDYVDHAGGTESTIPNTRLVRDATGQWHQVESEEG
ncbi:MAG TPA: hypothetical protein VMF65_21730 [Acidimicrobiales bacterium]|nr:hypothetical protein [Acidimicrobiales bacterium]